MANTVSKEYTVQKGDTLSSIAKAHGTTYQDIAKANNIADPNKIYEGQTLTIGGSAASTGTAGGTPATNESQGYVYEPYKESANVTQKWGAVDTAKANAPGEWTGGTWGETLNNAINQIMNREKFSYDLNGDALYQQYKDKYIQQGKMAMMDTMGQAQAMTGGYGNSYAQTVGNQAYQSHLQQLNDIVPELYQMAYDKYNQEGQDMYNQASMLGQMYDQEYGQHRDSVSDYWTNLDYLTGEARYAAEDEYGKWSDKTTMDQTEFWNNKNFDYQAEQDALTEGWRQKEYDLALEQWDWQKEQAAAGGSGGGGGGGTGGDAGTEFNKAVFSRVDDNGNYVFYIDGKERTYAPGVNPYTGTKNSDTKNGTFSNGYQPDNVGGQKLTKSGITDVVNGVTQNVWKTPDGKLWIWDGTQNKYLRYGEPKINSAPNESATDNTGRTVYKF